MNKVDKKAKLWQIFGNLSLSTDYNVFDLLIDILGSFCPRRLSTNQNLIRFLTCSKAVNLCVIGAFLLLLLTSSHV